MSEWECCTTTMFTQIFTPRRALVPPRAAMALSKLSGDEQGIILVQLRNALEPRLAVYFSSASHELRALTPALLQQLRADHVSMRGIVHPWLGQIRLKRNSFKTLFKS